MAAGILAATGVVKPALVADAIALGELSLDGRIQPVRGLGTLHVPAGLRVAWGVRLHGWREASVRVEAVPAAPGPH